MSIVTEMYEDGINEGKKAGKLEILNDLLEVVSEWKSSSDVVSCDTVMQLLQTKQNSIKNK